YVILPVIAGLQRAADDRAFDRLARMLAKIGGDRAVEILAMHARTQRRYPRLAMRALSQCDHPLVVPALIDLLSTGRIKQRRAAAKYLAKVGKGRAIEPLCRMAARGGLDAGPEARNAFRKMGRPYLVARMVFEDNEMSTTERVDALEAMSHICRFNPDQFLQREMRRWLSPWKAAARDAADHLQLRRTLLRSSELTDGDSLLRPAGGASPSDLDRLVRPSD